MGILGNLAGNTPNWKKCKWCGNTYDADESYASTTSFCSEKCEKEYGDDRYGTDDSPEPKILYKTKVKRVLREVVKKEYVDIFPAWLTLNYAIYIFGKEREIGEFEMAQIGRIIKLKWRIDIFDLSFERIKDNVLNRWQEEYIDINKLNEMVSILVENTTYFNKGDRSQILDVIIRINKALSMYDPDREHELYNMLNVSVDEFNDYPHLDGLYK